MPDALWHLLGTDRSEAETGYSPHSETHGFKPFLKTKNLVSSKFQLLDAARREEMIKNKRKKSMKSIRLNFCRRNCVKHTTHADFRHDIVILASDKEI